MATKKNASAKQGKNTAGVGKGKPPKDTRWKPGQSGNPAGRKPLASTLAQHVRDIGAEVIDQERGWTRLDAVIRRLYSDAMGGKHNAAAIILDRGWGKPPQPVTVQGMSDDELREFIASAAREIGIAGGGAPGSEEARTAGGEP